MKPFFLTLLFIFLLQLTFAQNSPPEIPHMPGNTQEKKFSEKIGKRWVWGGNFSVIFKPVLVNVSPTLGYRLSEKITTGVGIGGIYNRVPYSDSTINKTVFTGSVFTKLTMWKILNAQVEYELMQSNVKNSETGIKRSKILHNPLAGGGLKLPIFQNVSLQLTLLYNFNYNKEFSPYPSPWIFRMGLGR